MSTTLTHPAEHSPVEEALLRFQAVGATPWEIAHWIDTAASMHISGVSRPVAMELARETATGTGSTATVAGLRAALERAEKEWDVALRLATETMDSVEELLRHRASCHDCAARPGVDSARPEEHDFQSSFPSPAKGMRYQAERDEARAMAALWKEATRRLSKRAHGLGWERDQHRAGEEEAEARAAKAEEQLAAEPRPLTPDDIDGPMVERARSRGCELVGALWDREVVEAMIVAALTVPARPEGAEEWDEELGEMPAAEDLTPEQRTRLADALAERDHALGVRVEGSGR